MRTGSVWSVGARELGAALIRWCGADGVGGPTGFWVVKERGPCKESKKTRFPTEFRGKSADFFFTDATDFDEENLAGPSFF